jgi:hypothetical protein
MSIAHSEPVAMVGTACLDGELTPQHKIVVGALAGNHVATSERLLGLERSRRANSDAAPRPAHKAIINGERRRGMIEK